MLQKISATALALALGFTVQSSKAHAQEDTESYVGVGITIEVVKSEDKKTKETMIVDLLDRAPAQRSGIKAGDYIRAVDGKATQNQKLETVSEWISGQAGTNVVFSIQSPGSEARDVTLMREVLTYTCFMKGWVNLTFYGDQNSGSFSGYIGGHYTRLDVFGGFATGFYKNQYLRLNVNNFGNNLELSGFVGYGYVRWTGFGNQISTYQSCLR
ncbi:MAG: PDZ domain-containing protein [Bdellovibrionales bacterium]